MIHLFLDSENQLRYIENMPREPRPSNDIYYQQFVHPEIEYKSACAQYQQALAKAKSESILVSNQEEVKRFIELDLFNRRKELKFEHIESLDIDPRSFYTLPVDQYRVEVRNRIIRSDINNKVGRQTITEYFILPVKKEESELQSLKSRLKAEVEKKIEFAAIAFDPLSCLAYNHAMREVLKIIDSLPCKSTIRFYASYSHGCLI